MGVMGYETKDRPVEEIVPGHHTQEACGVRHGVQLVVELLKLLVQKIPRLALRLTAGSSPVGTGTGCISASWRLYGTRVPSE